MIKCQNIREAACQAAKCHTENKCNPFKCFFKKNFLIYFCEDSKILLYDLIEIEKNKKIYLKNHRIFKIDPKIPKEQIKSSRFYYGNIIFILTTT